MGMEKKEVQVYKIKVEKWLELAKKYVLPEEDYHKIKDGLEEAFSTLDSSNQIFQKLERGIASSTQQLESLDAELRKKQEVINKLELELGAREKDLDKYADVEVAVSKIKKRVVNVVIASLVLLASEFAYMKLPVTNLYSNIALIGCMAGSIIYMLYNTYKIGER